MSESSALEAAARRLEQALDDLDAAMERRREADRGGDALAAQVQALGADRARLADELDAAAARGRQIEIASDEAARRIETAMSAIRGVMDRHGA
ncbi:MAG TPA: DUF4164 family protein [Xanthobacteraceae bacterium]|nr:DUF4164 family protein [Xanthobacteraceae bacterium]